MLFHTWGAGVCPASKLISCSYMGVWKVGPLRTISTMSVISVLSFDIIILYYKVIVRKNPTISLERVHRYYMLVGLTLLYQGEEISTKACSYRFLSLTFYLLISGNFCGNPKAPFTPLVNSRIAVSNQPSPLRAGHHERGVELVSLFWVRSSLTIHNLSSLTKVYYLLILYHTLSALSSVYYNVSGVCRRERNRTSPNQ